jgi:hypothetical protein
MTSGMAKAYGLTVRARFTFSRRGYTGCTPLVNGESTMGLVALLLILALIFGGIGLFVEGLKWLLIIALVLFVVSFFTGFRGRSAAL